MVFSFSKCINCDFILDTSFTSNDIEGIKWDYNIVVIILFVVIVKYPMVREDILIGIH